MKSFLLATALLATSVVSAFSEAAVQTNAPPKKNPWDASATLGLTLTEGNSKTLLASGQIAANKKWGDKSENELNLGADGVYGQQEVQESDGSKQTQTSANSIHGFAQYNRLFTERLYGFGRIEGLSDEIALIHYRFTLTAGAGYYLIKQTNLFLRAELGPG